MSDFFERSIRPELLADLEQLTLQGQDYGISFEVRPDPHDSDNRHLAMYNPDKKELLLKGMLFASLVNAFVAMVYAVLDNQSDEEILALEEHYCHDRRFSGLGRFRQDVLEWYG